MGAVATLVVIACLAFMVFISSRAPQLIELEESDRRELVPAEIEGASFLRHPELGFAIPDPGPDLVVSTHIVDATRAAGGDAFFRTHHVWAWEGDETELVVELARVRERSREAIVRSVAEVAPNVADDALLIDGFSARIERTLGNGGLHLSRIELIDGALLADRALAERGAGAHRLVLTVVTRPDQRDRWSRWLEQVRASRETSETAAAESR